MIVSIIEQAGGLAWTVLAFVVALSIIVGVHEYGHYIVGRWSGIRAEVFSLGFGPRLAARRDRRGTLWQIAAIPLGGYVRFLGDADAASVGGRPVDPALVRQTLGGAPLWARAATVAAGPAFNFALAALVFAGVIGWQGVASDGATVGRLLPAPPGVGAQLLPGDLVVAVGGHPVADWAAVAALAPVLPPAPVQDWTVRRGGAELTVAGPDVAPPRIDGIAGRSAAAAADLRPGDVILSIDGQPIARFAELRPAVEAAAGRPVLLRVWREGAGEAEVSLSARQQDVPAADGFERRWLIGVTGGAGYVVPATRTPGPFEALRMGLGQTWSVIAGSIAGLWATATGQIGTCTISGAISIAEVAGQAAHAGAGNFLWLIGVLSAGIGFLNLLPIPMLDGGHLAFYAYEAVRGRPPSPRTSEWLLRIGTALVLALMLFGLFNDLRCR